MIGERTVSPGEDPVRIGPEGWDVVGGEGGAVGHGTVGESISFHFEEVLSSRVVFSLRLAMRVL